ncbi:MAG: hypothetical protein JRJ15_06700 [Deltaproteobacteria bacterium]|nr:hypothetical protein [Deltaproteobacteria bacterium]
MDRTQEIIAGIGLEKKRVGIIIGSKENPKSLAKLVEEIFESVFKMEPSPVLKQTNRT